MPIPPKPPSPSPESIKSDPLASTTTQGFLNSDPALLDDFFAFCKKMSPKEFEKIVKEGQLMRYGPDSIVYLQGEPSDSFYVINDGTAEVIIADEEGQSPMSITYLSKGDLFGEIGLLTEAPRSASVRIPESANLLRFDKIAFSRMITSIPAFGHYLAMILARRLRKTTLQLHFYSNARELSGSLDFFDLPTIFQTISLSQQHGIMHVFSLTAEILGEFAFINGLPVSARYSHLYGIEALLQLFIMPPKANFGFTRLNEPPVVEGSMNIPNVNEFIMSAVHFKDEMLVLQEKLAISEEQPIKKIHSRMEWPYSDLQECAKDLWQILMKEPKSMQTISSSLPYSRYSILQVLDRLFQTGQLAFAEITPYGYR